MGCSAVGQDLLVGVRPRRRRPADTYAPAGCGAEGVGVVFAQDADAVGQDLLVQGDDGLGEASAIVCALRVVAGWC